MPASRSNNNTRASASTPYGGSRRNNNFPIVLNPFAAQNAWGADLARTLRNPAISGALGRSHLPEETQRELTRWYLLNDFGRRISQTRAALTTATNNINQLDEDRHLLMNDILDGLDMLDIHETIRWAREPDTNRRPRRRHPHIQTPASPPHFTSNEEWQNSWDTPNINPYDWPLEAPPITTIQNENADPLTAANVDLLDRISSTPPRQDSPQPSDMSIGSSDNRSPPWIPAWLPYDDLPDLEYPA